MSLREAFLASPSLTPGSDAARKMTVTSGLQCSAALTKSGPIGSFVRTLLESSRWWSRARLLQWQVRPLYSTRTTTFVDTNSERPLPCNASATTSAVTDTKSSRFLFRLAVLEPPTEGTGCSSSDTELLPTPVVVDNPHPNSKVNESGRRFNQKAESSHSMGLADRAHHNILPQPSQIKYDPRVQPFLKTPCAADSWSDTMESKGVSGTSGTLAQEVVSGYAAKHRGLMLPTPTARDEKNPSSPDGERIQRKMQQGWTIELNDLAPMGMLPTPLTRDYKGGTTAIRKDTGKVRTDALDSLVKYRMEELTEGSAEQDGQTSRLSPLFTEEMMGFPFLWTTLPFLSPSGAPKPSKPTATPSSPK